MRLLHRDASGKITLVKTNISLERPTTPYAILSHTWSQNEEDEVNIDDVFSGTFSSKPGWRKIRFCLDQAAADKLHHVWVDTCCIDQYNEVELSESIRSMNRWYSQALKCYVYLSDVHCKDLSEFSPTSFLNSQWHRRGWTLQELLAPRSVQFYSAEGCYLGDKRSLEKLIHKATRIDVDALRSTGSRPFKRNDIFTWAAFRQTKRDEDSIYSLLGLFDVHIPIMYGEGRENARRRLLRELDYDDIVQKSMDNAAQIMRLLDGASRDSASLKVITLVTIMFLPGMFVATFFGMDFVDFSPPDGRPMLNESMLRAWVATTLPLTVVTLVAWMIYNNLHRIKENGAAKKYFGFKDRYSSEC